MTAEAFYRYLMSARRALCATLRALPEDQLSAAVIPTEGARCIKDLLMHMAVVEDGWFRGDLLGQPTVLETLGVGAPGSAAEYWHHDHRPLDWLLSYWEAVEQATLASWPALLEQAAQHRRIPVDESRPETLSADEVLWHVMQHEVRHSAQVVQMIRLLGHRPPALDLVFHVARGPEEA
ncbi:DUF664 domain-containing protein [Deinococcus sp. HMF7620]|uniref:DUF664 domain-containing protein n=1 Tax=Deinococcus arboris TaxID=2682977 RepID=A0A7C9LUC0_9DEIO|nr:DinB family protein [Deinococcus arboris]MVN87180.1 DUF664 domain-containing protein [Deinococcus arboris]